MEFNSMLIVLSLDLFRTIREMHHFIFADSPNPLRFTLQNNLTIRSSRIDFYINIFTIVIRIFFIIHPENKIDTILLIDPSASSESLTYSITVIICSKNLYITDCKLFLTRSHIHRIDTQPAECFLFRIGQICKFITTIFRGFIMYRI